MKLVDANSLQHFWNKIKDATLLKGEQTLTPEEQTQVKQNLGISEGG